MRDPAVLEPQIRAHLEAENAYTEAQLADTRLLQEQLFLEMKGRLKQDDSTVPAPDGAYAYASRFVAGGQYPLLCRRPRGKFLCVDAQRPGRRIVQQLYSAALVNVAVRDNPAR